MPRRKLSTNLKTNDIPRTTESPRLTFLTLLLLIAALVAVYHEAWLLAGILLWLAGANVLRDMLTEAVDAWAMLLALFADATGRLLVVLILVAGWIGGAVWVVAVHGMR